MPNEESELWYTKLRASVLQLTSDVFNVHGLNVVDLATVVGAVPLLDELLNTPDVYLFRNHDSVDYDITYLTPQAIPDATSSSGRRLKTKKNSVVPVAPEVAQPSSAGKKSAGDQLTFTNDSTATVGHPRTSKSCLDLIVEMEDEILAARILDLSPFRQLVQNYWKTYQWLYVTLMIVHVAYMIVFTSYVLPDSAMILDVYNATNKQSCSSPDLLALFLIWPGLVLIFLVYYTISTIVRYC